MCIGNVLDREESADRGAAASAAANDLHGSTTEATAVCADRVVDGAPTATTDKGRDAKAAVLNAAVLAFRYSGAAGLPPPRAAPSILPTAPAPPPTAPVPPPTTPATPPTTPAPPPTAPTPPPTVPVPPPTAPVPPTTTRAVTPSTRAVTPSTRGHSIARSNCSGACCHVSLTPPAKLLSLCGVKLNKYDWRKG